MEGIHIQDKGEGFLIVYIYPTKNIYVEVGYKEDYCESIGLAISTAKMRRIFEYNIFYKGKRIESML